MGKDFRDGLFSALVSVVLIIGLCPLPAVAYGHEPGFASDSSDSLVAGLSNAIAAQESQAASTLNARAVQALTGNGSSIAQVTLGNLHSAAITSDGSLWTWGNNASGELGDGTTTMRTTPVKVMDDVAQVSLGDQHSAAVKSDGSLWLWGENGRGQLGDGTTVGRHSPVKVMDGVSQVSLGGFHSAAIRSDGSLMTWGYNTVGQLGNGTEELHVATPVKVMDGVSQVSLGNLHSAAIKSDGSLWAWGEDAFGEIGNGAAPGSSAPVRILENVAQVSLAGKHSAAVTADGSLWSWGDNSHGEVGDGTTVGRISPVKIMDGVSWASLGRTHSAAVKSDGSLWTWGENDFYGALGDGSTTNRFTPAKVMSGVWRVSLGYRDSAVIKADGSLWTWGFNFFGQLADKDAGESRAVPACVFRNGKWISGGGGVSSNELDFSKDVWGFRNYSHEQCYIGEDMNKNSYIGKLKPTSRSIVLYSARMGSEGHCFGMSTTVILNKLGLEDMTRWDGVGSLREIGKETASGVCSYMRCYYHKMQMLADFNLEVQRFQKKSAVEQLSSLGAKADNVKRGGAPVLLCFEKEGWGAHAVVAYALESGSFKSSRTGRQYDRRVLLYDCNAVDWSEDTCLLFNQGAGDWEIPYYASKGVTSSDGAYLTCATDDSKVYDAVDNADGYSDYCPVIDIDSESEVIIEEPASGGRWVVDAKGGRVSGTSELFSYRSIDAGDGEAGHNLHIVLPNGGAAYTVKAASGQATSLDFNVLYAGNYLSVQADSATSAVVAPDGAVSVDANSGEYMLVSADDEAQEDGSYDTYSVSGNSPGSVSLSLTGYGVKVEGDNIRGATMTASNGTSSSSVVIEGEKAVEYGNRKAAYEDGNAAKSDIAAYAGKARGAGFRDLRDSDWYMRVPDGAFANTSTLYLDYTIAKGLMSGYDAATFAPDDAMTRAMAATIIYRMATGKTAASTDNGVATKFADVPAGRWYSAAVKWCSDNGVVTGYTDGSGRFDPDGLVTREQLVTMIARYCERVESMAASDKDVSHFKDHGDIADYALDGVAFCNSHGIVSGMGDTGYFDPRGQATRCQMAKIIAVTARMLE